MFSSRSLSKRHRCLCFLAYLSLNAAKPFGVSPRVQTWQKSSSSHASTFAIPARLERLPPVAWFRPAGPVGVAFRPLPKISAASFSFCLRLRSCCGINSGACLGGRLGIQTGLNYVIEGRAPFASSHLGDFRYLCL